MQTDTQCLRIRSGPAAGSKLALRTFRAVMGAVSCLGFCAATVFAAAPEPAVPNAFSPALQVTPENAQSIRSLDFSGGVGKLVVRTGDGYRIEAGPEIADYVKYEIEDGVFRCWDTYDNLNIGNWFKMINPLNYMVVVTIPADAALQEASIHSASGGMNADGIQAGIIRIETSSGSADVSNMRADDFSLSGGSGSVRVNNVTSSGPMKIQGASGGVKAEDISARNLDLKGSSGKLDVVNGAAEENLTAAFGSGGANLQGVTAQRADIETASGGLNAREARFAGGLSMRASSGSVGMDGEIGGLDLQSKSGSVRLGGLTGSISADTGPGGVRLGIQGDKSDYSVDLNAGSGGISMDGSSVGKQMRDSEEKTKHVRVKGASGRVSIEFSN